MSAFEHDDLLREYMGDELAPDGYPWEWHREVQGRYFPEVKEPRIPDYVRECAGHRCLRCGHPYRAREHGSGEWSPCDSRCTHPRGPRDTRWRREERDKWRPGTPTLQDLEATRGGGVKEEAAWRILTVHHLDEDKANCRWWNLAALCQRCHLRMQRGVVMGRPYAFEHSAWFKPFAAGFYAWKYLGEDLDRAEVAARMEELLKLEHRFTQEVLL